MTTALAVLDTNVVLDWLVFDNPGVAALVTAISAGSITWVGCQAMRDELAHVLTHANLKNYAFDKEQVLTSVDRWSQLRQLPQGLPVTRHRCRDPSDQMYVDLALAHGARWLLTRDRALLELARKLVPHGLLVQTPEAWRNDTGAG